MPILMFTLSVIGILISMVGTMMLGADISAALNLVFGSDHQAFKFTSIIEVMRHWTPEAWSDVVNYINYGTPSFAKTVLELSVSLPISIVCLIAGLSFVLAAVMLQRYRVGY